MADAPSTRRTGGLRWSALAVAATLVLIVAWGARAGADGAAPTSPSPEAAFQALASYEALQQSLYLPGQLLYRPEPGQGGTDYSYLWDFTNALAATEYLIGTPGESAEIQDLQDRLSGLMLYLDPYERDPSDDPQPPGFESAVPPPTGPGGATYFDDDDWVVLDLLYAYDLTAEPTFLQWAEETIAFVEAGWSSDGSLPCAGGVYWVDAASSRERNTTSTAPLAEAAAELYEITGQAGYLDWAEQAYSWVEDCLRSPTGLYYDHIDPDGTVDQTLWSYNQGSMIGAGVALYEATGQPSYLQAAETTAAAAVSHYGTGAQLVSQGPAFNAIYFRDLALLDQVSPDPAYSAEMTAYAAEMWTGRDPSGLIDPSLGVNGTAPMVEIYSLLAGAAVLPRPPAGPLPGATGSP